MSEVQFVAARLLPLLSVVLIVACIRYFRRERSLPVAMIATGALLLAGVEIIALIFPSSATYNDSGDVVAFDPGLLPPFVSWVSSLAGTVLMMVGMSWQLFRMSKTRAA